jgi:uncharacterized caspase-like protein
MSPPRTFRNAVLAVLAALAVALATRSAGLADEPAQPAGRKYALLVGINQYAAPLQALQYPQDDVEELARVLTSSGYEPANIWLMTYREAGKSPRWYPDRKHILEALDLLLQDRAPADSILVAFAGHGVQFKDDSQTYFCPRDADLSRKDTLLSLTDVYGRLKQCGAGVKVMLVDACRQDPQADTSRAAREVRLRSSRLQQQQPPGGVAVLFSCAAGQQAFEDDHLRHGIFFHYVIEGLRGAAAGPSRQVTLNGLYEYVAGRVDDYARATKEHSQRPSLMGELSGPVTLVSLAGPAANEKPVVAEPPPTEPGRELRRLTGHQRTVTGVAFLPDGRRALSGSLDGTLRVWDLDTGAELACLQGEDAGWVRSVAVSADGRFALSGGEDRVVRLWDLTAGTEVKQLRGHTDTVYSVSISPDGRLGLSGSADRAVRLWDLETGAEVTTFQGHAGAVRSVAFAADGRSALSGGADRTVRLWDVLTGKEVRRFEGHTDTVLGVALSRDGRFALSGGSDRSMRLWDARTGQEVRCFRGDLGKVLAVAFSPEGKRALCGGADRALWLWDADTGRSLGTLRGHETCVQCVAFSPDGRRALSGAGGPDQDDTVRLWQLPH